MVELRKSGGMRHLATAFVFGIAVYLARLQWAHARAWLRKPIE